MAVSYTYFKRILMSAVPSFLINRDQTDLALQIIYICTSMIFNSPRQLFQARTLDLPICMAMNKMNNESSRQH